MTYKSPTAINWSRGGEEIFHYMNEVSFSVFGWLLLVCIHVIFAFSVSYYKRDLTMALAISGFVTLLVAILFRIGGVINTLTLAICITVVVIELLVFLFDKGREVQ